MHWREYVFEQNIQDTMISLDSSNLHMRTPAGNVIKHMKTLSPEASVSGRDK